jgi:hypothetical protein
VSHWLPDVIADNPQQGDISMSNFRSGQWLNSTALISLIAVVGSVQMALAAEPAGETTMVKTIATASGAGASRPLTAESQVFIGEMIKTNGTGVAQLLFLDKTRMVIGPNSELTIDEFVYQSNGTVSSLVIGATRGAFRFLSGSSEKAAYRIDTPLASIGVRGTAGDITIHEDGSASFAIYEGAFRICTREDPRRCAILEESCTVITLDTRNNFEWKSNIFERTQYMAENFPFAFANNGLQKPYRVRSGSCNVQSGVVPEPFEPSSTPPRRPKRPNDIN